MSRRNLKALNLEPIRAEDERKIRLKKVAQAARMRKQYEAQRLLLETSSDEAIRGSESEIEIIVERTFFVNVSYIVS